MKILPKTDEHVEVDYLDLFFHGDTKEHDKVNHEDRPKDWNVKELEESAERCKQHCLQCAVPKTGK